jgi:hypothetical protein
MNEVLPQNTSGIPAWISEIPVWLLALTLAGIFIVISYAIYDNRTIELWPPKIHAKNDVDVDILEVQLSGQWDYLMRCPLDNASVSGSSSFNQKGRVLEISGTRTKETWNDQESRSVSYSWRTVWAEVGLDGKVRFEYRITREHGENSGYCSLSLVKSVRPALRGSCYLLVGSAQERAQFGSIEFQKTSNRPN